MSQTDVPVPDSPAPDDEAAAAQSDAIVAGPEVGYRWKHLIMAILMIGAGGWFAYDGWINWPRQNQNAVRIEKELEQVRRANTGKDDKKISDLAAELNKYEKHNDASILLQKILAMGLPAGGIFWGAWTIRDTRGQYRLAGNPLHVPGHPPVT